MGAVIKLDEFWQCTAGECTGQPVETAEVSLEDLNQLLVGKTCRWDGEKLTNGIQVVLNAYEHDQGWSVVGQKHRLWLSVECPKCKYGWSIWKLGVAR